MNKKKKFYLMVFGCQMNHSDSERLASVLKKIGYKKTNKEEPITTIRTVRIVLVFFPIKASNDNLIIDMKFKKYNHYRLTIKLIY